MKFLMSSDCLFIICGISSDGIILIPVGDCFFLPFIGLVQAY